MTTCLNEIHHDTVFGHHIGGQWCTSGNGRVMERRNPSDQTDLIGYVPLATARDVHAAVDAAVKAQHRWRAVSAPHRSRIILQAARLLESRRASMAAAISREQGKTAAEADGEVSLAVNVLEYMSGEGRRLTGTTWPSEDATKFVYTVREPLGVVGLITPWNFPLAVPLWKIAPALVCGNTVVWKPSRLTPLTSKEITDLWIDAGVPDGVINVVNGAGIEAGAALVEHPAVRGISFTSSYEVGTQIYSTAASQFKKVQCEAGGKNAVIVLADADLQLAADSIVAGAFRYAGQRCTATSRVVVVDECADRLVEMLVDRATSLVVGRADDRESDMGPLTDEHQMTRVLECMTAARADARLVCGGRRLVEGSLERGLFVAPTIFDRVPSRAPIAQEEVFGPVISVVRVSDAREALTVANDNRYGMTASVFTNDAAQVFAIAGGLECGAVHINAPTIGAEVHVPFGGIKDTGVGDREMGPTAVNFYSEVKVVYVNQARRPTDERSRYTLAAVRP